MRQYAYVISCFMRSWCQLSRWLQRVGRVKQIPLLIIAGLVVAGCCSTWNEIQNLSTSDLHLRRYELMHCMSMTRMRLHNRQWQSHAYDDVKADLADEGAV